MAVLLSGISSISIGNAGEEPVWITPQPSVTYQKEKDGECSFGIIECSPEQMAALFPTHMEPPTYGVNITTRRTPRKLKKWQKKFGGYVGRKRIHIKNASIDIKIV